MKKNVSKGNPRRSLTQCQFNMTLWGKYSALKPRTIWQN